NGVMMTYGSGAAPRYFAWNCSHTSLVSPPDDFGTLTQSGNSYTYQSKYGVSWTYTVNAPQQALLQSITDPHGFAITFSYAGATLSAITWPDSSITSFTPAIIGVPGRSLGLRIDGLSNHLLGITDVDGTLRTFAYDGGHRLTNEQWTPLNISFGYDPTTG